MSSFEGKGRKSHLPIPPFSDNTFLTFKNSSKKNFRQAKKLSHAARSLQGKRFFDGSSKFTFGEKLTEIYLESAKKNEVRDGSFIKCDYLGKLVVQENLNHFIMKIFPSKMFCLFIKNVDRVHLLYSAGIEESVLLDSIDNEEIPVDVLDRIMDYDWDLMYDYHCILKIEKYSSQDHSAQPIFSSFVLLKPTSKVCIYLNNKYYHDYITLNGTSEEQSKKSQELEILLEISGPLYLDASPTALEFIDLVKTYQSPFGSTSLKLALAKKQAYANKQCLGVHSFEYEKKLLEDIESGISNESNRLKDEFYPEEINNPLFLYIDLKEELHSFLVNRVLKICEDMYNTETTLLVEVFELSISESILTANSNEKFEEFDTNYISVFWKNGLFYTCFMIDKYAFNPQDPNDFIPLMGDREKLDKFILKVAEILSCRFYKPLHIQYRNMIENTSKSFFLRRFSINELGTNCKKTSTSNTEWTTVLSDERNSKFDEMNYEKPLSSHMDTDSVYTDEDSNEFDEMNCEKPLTTDMGSDDLHCNQRNSELNEVNCEDSVHSDESNSELGEMDSEKLLTGGIESTLHSDENATKCSVENEDIKIDEDTLLKDNWESLSNIINSSSFRSIFSNKSSSDGTYNSSNTESHRESFIKGVYSIESDSVKTVFEAHPFEQSKRFDLSSGTASSGKRVEIYPSLKSEFEFTKEDFMKDMYHDHSTDIKKLLKIISGDED